VDAGFQCIKAPLSAAVLREMIRGTQSLSIKHIPKKRVKRGYTLILFLFSAA